MADFPEPGIQFKDLTPLFADARGFAAVTDALADVAAGATSWPASTPAASCSRGAVALRLGTGVLAVRKGGKLPPPVHGETYSLEYGTATLEIPARGHRDRRTDHRHHRRRAGHRRHARRHGAAACQGGRER